MSHYYGVQLNMKIFFTFSPSFQTRVHPYKQYTRKTQLSLGKKRYSLYRFYCSTVLTFKVVQSQWFSCYLKANMSLPV